ncbi:MAG: hypothetical protein H0W06_08610, partial [Chloroflexia bacterium]|nr:hypothetical protein [Chloroflexia bacterium]
MTIRRVLVTVVIAVLLAGSPALGMTRQDASPVASPIASPVASPVGGTDGAALDLAAMALDAGDLPPDYRLVSEAYASPELFSAQYTGGAVAVEELEATGFIRFYESRYASANGQQVVRSYASEYASDDGATGGFDLLEDESRFLPPGAELEDQPGPEVGESPKETTVARIPGFVDGFDTTFRVGRVLVGVAVETNGTTAPDAALSEELAPALFDRVDAVLAGDAPAGVDFALPAALLPLTELGPTGQAGYLRAGEVLPDVEGEAADGSGYAQSASLGFPGDPTTPVVTVTTGVMGVPPSTFGDPETALANLDASTLLSILPVLTDSPRQPAPAPEIAGAEAVVASRAALLPGGFLDTARITFVVGDRIGVIEVAGAATAAEAETTARDLATRQAACLAAAEPCADVPTATEIQASALRAAGGIDAAATPAATPASDEEAARLALFGEVWTTVKRQYIYRTG